MSRLLFFLPFASILLCSHSPDLTKGNETKIKPGPIESNPSFFEENKGQVRDQFYKPRPDVLFSGEANGLTHHIFENGISYQLSRVESWKAEEERPGMTLPGEEPRQVPDEISIYRVDVRWVNAQKNLVVKKGAASKDYTNYYNVPEGTEPALDVRNYETVTFKNVWQGVDLMYYSREGVLESDWLVQKAEDYTQIRFQIKGAELEIDPQGFLVMKTPFGEIREGKLKVYQSNKELTARWVLTGDEVSFEIDGFQPGQPLRIDPPIRLWGTYYGGSDGDHSYSCAVDDTGNVFLAGRTYSTQSIATTGAHQTSFGGGNMDAFLVKFDTNGNRLWGTYYGGSDEDQGRSCAVDDTGNVYLAGLTHSIQNISTTGAHQTIRGGGVGGVDAFLVKFNASGIRQWGTYYGGSDWEDARSCAVDDTGNVYLAGVTSSAQDISTTGTHQTILGGGVGEPDAFLVKFDANGIRQWGTYYGGSEDDCGNSCAVDDTGNVYLAGWTSSTQNIATTGAYQTSFGGGNMDAFLVKFNANGTRQWGTYYGGSDGDRVFSCAVDTTGNVYLAGETKSTQNIATTDAHQRVYGGGNWDAFLVKFDLYGNRIWATYYGGSDIDFGYSCTVDANGEAYLAGWTNSIQNIATTSAYQTSLGGQYDAFLVKFNADGLRLWGTYYGGISVDFGYSCKTDMSGNVFLAGSALSTQNIATPSAHQPTYGGGAWDAFLVKLLPCDSVEVLSHPITAQFNTVPGEAWFTCMSPATIATYQWQEDAGSGWVNLIDSGLYMGTRTDSLHIFPITTDLHNYQYRCIVNGCAQSDTSDAATLLVWDNMSLENNELPAFSIFPNPSSGIFRVESENTIQSYEVLEVTGNTVLSGKPKASRFDIDLGKYPAGVYFIQLTVDGKTVTGRVVKMD